MRALPLIPTSACAIAWMRSRLTELFGWSAAQFEQRMRGSAIYRIGYQRWLRNIAVALGNAASTPAVLAALNSRREDPSALVREHVVGHWPRTRAPRRSRRRARYGGAVQRLSQSSTTLVPSLTASCGLSTQ